MSENENGNSSPELGSNPSTTQGEGQNNNQQQTPAPDNNQNPDDQQITGEQFEPDDENVPEEIKEETKKLGKGEPDAFYRVPEEEYDKIKKCIPEDLQQAVVNSKIENGAPPQLWLPVINNVVFGLVAFVPGLNIAYAAVLYANLKILPMWPKKKVKNYTQYSTTENRPTKTENSPSTPSSSFETRDENNGKESFGSRNEDGNKGQSFGTKDNGNGKQNFGLGNNNGKQSFGTKNNSSNTKQNFGAKTTANPPNTSFGTKSANNTGMNFGTASANPVLGSLTKVKQSFGTGKASSLPATSPATHVNNLKNKTRRASFSIGNPK